MRKFSKELFKIARNAIADHLNIKGQREIPLDPLL
jgi:hypothetical protein